MKKLVALLLVTMLLVGIIPVSLAAEKVELTLWHAYTSESTKTACEGVLDEFNASQDEIVIKYESFSTQDLLQAYALGVISGELPDLGFNDNPGWASLCELGVFDSIQTWFDGWEDNGVWLDNICASGYYNGELYGLPCSPNCLALWCNTEMLAKAGFDAPPKTWEEFYEIAKATTDPANGVYGFAMGCLKNESGTYQNLPWILSAGGSIFDLTSEETIYSIEFVNDLYANGYCSAESLNWSQSDALNQFLAGNAAMYISGSWNVATQRKNAPDLQFTCTPIPGLTAEEYGYSVLGGELIGITKACKNREAAETFLEWFLSRDTQINFCSKCTRFSARNDVTAQDLFPNDDLMAIYNELLPTAAVRGPHPAWTEVSGVFQNIYQMIYAGGLDVKTGLADGQVEVDAIMAEYAE